MNFDFLALFRLAAYACISLWFVEFLVRSLAARKVRHEFRAKGFMQRPSGLGWYHFLQRKHYNMFDDSIARGLFAIARLCMMAMIFIVGGVLLFTGCALVLDGLS